MHTKRQPDFTALTFLRLDGQVHHFAVTYSEYWPRWYLDGVEIESFGEVAVFSKKLTGEQIAALAAKPKKSYHDVVEEKGGTFIDLYPQGS